ncbi:hypothetical protein TraAM80_08141 [Trypanosoma rangeli]|uniref:Uncharacterized protein n=1 Tax=Trypanosoma rangeli TaxID=5698 RepID=A0A3R7MBB6_TRYRA|nr:uncharacterized protein TraAM80_08141 [Trypanosoma rangeli]RNE99507.1 hypothetical protein TraAM80_08141 [Trypanosoma rangeli]|eukprot:RNE99507.1 hypothetical protein TraAM80_08141 [Trypanosoma rangeli]
MKSTMSEPSLVSFTFPLTKTLSCCLRYLCIQSNAIKIIFSHRCGCSELRLAGINIPECSFSEIVIEIFHNNRIIEASNADITSIKKSVSWAVDGPLMFRALRLFEGYIPLTLELTCDLTSVLMYQEECGRWARIGALHDLGPTLNVDHGIMVLHRVHDLQAFCHIVRFIATSEEVKCTVALRFDNLQTFIELKNSNATASALVEGELLQGHVEGSARTAELFGFAELAMRVSDTAALFVGLGSDNLAMFRLDWQSVPSERSSAFLYFSGS